MFYKKLEESGLIEQTDIDCEEIMALLEVVDRDVKTAEKLVDINLDWSFNLSYNAMLQICLAFMYAKGYRPRGVERHKTVLRFVRSALKGWGATIDRIDRIRKKRHRITYQVAGIVSKQEAKATILLAKRVTSDLKKMIRSEMEK